MLYPTVVEVIVIFFVLPVFLSLPQLQVIAAQKAKFEAVERQKQAFQAQLEKLELQQRLKAKGTLNHPESNYYESVLLEPRRVSEFANCNHL